MTLGERARLPRPARTSWPPWTISATAGPGRCSGAAEADQPGQGAVPGPPAGAAEGRAAVSKRELHRLRGPDRAGHPAVPDRRPLNMNRFPGGAGTQGFWHKAAARARAGLAAALAPARPQGGRGRHLPGGGRAGGAGLGGQLRRAGVARLDGPGRRAGPAHLRADRHRPRDGHELG